MVHDRHSILSSAIVPQPIMTEVFNSLSSLTVASGRTKCPLGFILMPVSSAAKLPDPQHFVIPQEADSTPLTKVLSASRGLP
jgi:hypothetical protein